MGKAPIENDRRGRYQIAVYGIVFALGIILILASLVFNWQTPWQDIWINLGAGLVGVGILFFLVDRFFLADEVRLSDQIDEFLRRMDQSGRPSAEAFFTSHPELAPFLRTATQIDLAGVTLSNTLNENFGLMRERLLDGADIRILVSDPDSLALAMSALRTGTPDDPDYSSRRLATSFKDIRYLSDAGTASPSRGVGLSSSSDNRAKKKGTLSVRLLPYAPSFGIVRFRDANHEETMLVGIYPHGSEHLLRPEFILTPGRDGEWYEYFAKQFEYMWTMADEWQATEDAEGETRLLERRTSQARAADFLVEKHYISRDLLENASTICITGVTLERTIRDNFGLLQDRLVDGATVRVMILAATKPLLTELAQRSAISQTPFEWRDQLKGTEAYLRGLAQDPAVTGRLELGHLPYLPSFGGFMVDPDAKDGMISVEVYPHRHSGNNPTFQLRAGRDGKWYRFFKQQFDLLWASCKVEVLTPKRDQSVPQPAVTEAEAPGDEESAANA